MSSLTNDQHNAILRIIKRNLIQEETKGQYFQVFINNATYPPQYQKLTDKQKEDLYYKCIDNVVRLFGVFVIGKIEAKKMEEGKKVEEVMQEMLTDTVDMIMMYDEFFDNPPKVEELFKERQVERQKPKEKPGQVHYHPQGYPPATQQYIGAVQGQVQGHTPQSTPQMQGMMSPTAKHKHPPLAPHLALGQSPAPSPALAPQQYIKLSGPQKSRQVRFLQKIAQLIDAPQRRKFIIYDLRHNFDGGLKDKEKDKGQPQYNQQIRTRNKHPKDDDLYQQQQQEYQQQKDPQYRYLKNTMR